MRTDKLLTEYEELKMLINNRHVHILNTIREWFTENYPSILLLSVYVNERPMIDQVCITFHRKLPPEVVRHFSDDFMLELQKEICKNERQYNLLKQGDYRDKALYRYSFKVR